jgi:P27 family predicted phage terminase small subunit
MPDWLSPDAKQLWQSLVPQLPVSAVDSITLAALCDWFAIYRQTRQALDEVDRQSTNYYKLFQLTGMAWNNFSGIAAKFGLTPSDRAKLQAPSSPAARHHHTRTQPP